MICYHETWFAPSGITNTKAKRFHKNLNIYSARLEIESSKPTLQRKRILVVYEWCSKSRRHFLLSFVGRISFVPALQNHNMNISDLEKNNHWIFDGSNIKVTLKKANILQTLEVFVWLFRVWMSELRSDPVFEWVRPVRNPSKWQ